MSFRISTSAVFSQGLNTMLHRAQDVSRTQQQISSGKRVQSAVDDPAGSAAVMRISDQQARLESYGRNIATAEARLAHEETVIDSGTLALQRVRELALAANNAPLGSEERRMLQMEMDQRLQELLAIANTRDSSGEYLFAGSQYDTKPFALTNTYPATVYNGDQNSRKVDVADGQQVTINDSGFSVFQAIRRGNGSFYTQAAATNTGAGLIGPGTVVDPSLYDSQPYQLHAAVLTTPTTGPLVFNDQGTDDALALELRINGVLVGSFTEGAAPTAADFETAINAQTASTGVRAVADGPNLYLLSTVPGAEAIELSETLAGSTDGSDSVQGVFGLKLEGPGASHALTFGPQADAYVVEDSAGGVVGSGELVSGGAIQFAGVQVEIVNSPELGDFFDVNPSTYQDVLTTVAKLRDAMSFSGAALGNAVNQALADLDQSIENFDAVRAAIGSRLSRLEVQAAVNDAVNVLLSDQRSSIEDVDLVEAASRLSHQITVLEASQQSFLRIQGLTLFDLLR